MISPIFWAIALSFVVQSLGNNYGHYVKKRIVWGKGLQDLDSYDSLGYHVAMANGNRCSKTVYLFRRIFGRYDVCAPIVGELLFSGALILPNVVETCCHCIANFAFINISYAEPEPMNSFESWVSVFHGFTLVTDMNEEGTWSRMFYIHPRCAQLERAATHDFGLILLNQPVLMSRPFLRYAPVYTRLNLERQFHFTTQKESVCLFIGFGRYYWTDALIEGSPSVILMHGWRVIKSFWWCYWETWLVPDKETIKTAGYSFKDMHTWACTFFFGKERAHLMTGDSGAPVQCNGQFFALNSFETPLFRVTNQSVQMVAAIAYGVLENAIEYRKSLLNMVMTYTVYSENLAPRFRPNLTQFYEERYEEMEKQYPRTFQAIYNVSPTIDFSVTLIVGTTIFIIVTRLKN